MMGGPGGPGRLLNTEVSKPKNTFATLGRFGEYFRKYWPGALLALAMIVASTWTQVTAPDLIGQAVDCYLFPQPASCWYTSASANASADARVAGLLGLVGILLALFVAGSIFGGLSFYSMNWSGQRALRQIREDLFNQIHRLSLGYYAQNEAGNVMSRITSDTDTIQQALGFALINVLSGALLIVWIIVKMLQANVSYALLSLSVVPVMALATFYFSNQARKAFRQSRREMGNVNAGLQESIAGVREVQAFNREDESIEQFRRANAANRDANVRAASFTTALNPVLEALGYVALAIVVVVGGLSLLRGQPLFGGSAISLGVVFAFLQYVQRFNQPIQQIAVMWTNVQSAIAGGERIFGLLDVEPDIADRPGARAMPPIQGHVAFEDVSFSYAPAAGATGTAPAAGATPQVLKGISFVAEPGQMVAIVGPTGAGKTTIINLLPRFYDVTGGAVTIDGIDVRDVTRASLRGQIGIVLQDSFLFSDTVMNNIRYGRLDATDDEVIAAARLASADTFIERLPDGYQTVLGERGSGLSQGQRQLISIARAALANPRILILDEATSSVDTRTERLIQRAFDQLLEGRTSFVIAHRLSTIRHADQVLMLKDGQIIERGSHDELLAHRGAYYDLYMSQFRREEEQVEAG
ncbi:MAG TPA: ABC transporter ATP-binding protein [Kouleothrix sp.]|uniref:ABC transporter ATP-binding protein n=1 Tax=Kouleothrix sp. TaxID=2779161 RepID=UPI002C6E2836|nr:ABC transporter ATP-binding protein [Kouleothrix sp.]HRC74690.1 ABC transporter ATP-binding protein [Kouleothrix sp.]